MFISFIAIFIALNKVVEYFKFLALFIDGTVMEMSICNWVYQWSAMREQGVRERRQDLGKYGEKYGENRTYWGGEENVLP